MGGKRGRGAHLTDGGELSRRAVVAARVLVPNGPGDVLGTATSPTLPERGQGQSFGWSSLLSGLPGEPDEEDHEGWVERLFGNERSGCISPPNPSLLGDPKLPSPVAIKKGHARPAVGAAQAVRCPTAALPRPSCIPRRPMDRCGRRGPANTGWLRLMDAAAPCPLRPLTQSERG